MLLFDLLAVLLLVRAQRPKTTQKRQWTTTLTSCVTSLVCQQILTTSQLMTTELLTHNHARNCSACCSTFTTLSRLERPTQCYRCVWLLLHLFGSGSRAACVVMTADPPPKLLLRQCCQAEFSQCGTAATL